MPLALSPLEERRPLAPPKCHHCGGLMPSPKSTYSKKSKSSQPFDLCIDQRARPDPVLSWKWYHRFWPCEYHAYECQRSTYTHMIYGKQAHNYNKPVSALAPRVLAVERKMRLNKK